MTNTLLKIVFIDEKKDTRPFDFLGKNVYDATNILYKFVEDYAEISRIALRFEEKGYEYIIDNNTIYVMGVAQRLNEELKECLNELNERLRDLTLPDFSTLFADENLKTNEPMEDTEKDIIDKLAEKYRKEAEDKGKLS